MREENSKNQLYETKIFKEFKTSTYVAMGTIIVASFYEGIIDTIHNRSSILECLCLGGIVVSGIIAKGLFKK